MSTTSIDDLLLGGKTNQHPATPEDSHAEEPEQIEKNESDAPEYDEPEPEQEDDAEHQEHEEESEEKVKKVHETDEYGNVQEPENEAIRERLARQARKHQAEIDSLRAQLSQQGASPQVQQAAKDFEYDPDASGDWQQQLASFVKQTVNSMTREQEESKSRYQEQQVQAEFESKFREGMGKFNDFTETISELPFEITNPMTLATRAMADPAAFLYAAAKRQPKELERISKLRDPYAQMTEIGKLEERMRRNKVTTKAPRPLARTHEDTSTPVTNKKKETTIEDLIAKSDAKKLARVKGRVTNRR
jgi:hypothetical protein